MTAVDAPRTPPLADSSHPTLKRSSLNGGNLATPTRDNDAMSMSSFTDSEACCGGCRKLIDQENGGIVVAFGSSLWHVDCFRCAKCQEKVSADTNLLLLSDGSPVCGNCSYQCFVCKQAITEEAIMTGDESYHAHCFTCRTCKRRIEELVFAKTTQGIYCMSCHNERVARSRRHAELKRQRAARKEREAREEEAKKRAAAGEDTSRSQLSSSTTSTSLNVLSNFTNSPSASATSPSMSPHNGSSSHASPAQSPHVKAADRERERMGTHPHLPSPKGMSRGDSRDKQDQQRPQELSLATVGSSARAPSPRPSTADRSMPTSPSHDATPSLDPSSTSAPSATQGVSPGPSLVAPSPRSTTPRSPSGGAMSPSLGVPMTKSEKRRSINPGLVFNMDSQNETFAVDKDRSNTSSPVPTAADSKDTSTSTSTSLPAPTPSAPQITSTPSTPLTSSAPTMDQPKDTAPQTDGLKLEAPPSLPFSLSDPDFALLLTAPSDAHDGADSRTPPAASSPEPPADMPRTNGGSDHLSPNNNNSVPAGRTLRKRGSTESFMSVRLNPETDFAALMDEVGDAKADTVTLNRQLLSEFINEYKNLRETAVTLNTKYTGAKRSSQQYSEGLTIAGEEYDKEVSKRLDLESEVFRLRAQVHNQTARLSLISSDERRAENLRRRSQDLNNSLTGLERDISRLRAQRDISLAEVEELQNKNKNVGGSVEETTSKIGRSLTRRLETIKEQYKDELGPLAAQREVLEREINGLKDFRDELLEAATARAAENDALVELGLQLSKDLEAKQEMLARAVPFPNLKTSSGRGHPSGSPSISSLSSTPLQEVPEEATARVVKVVTRPEIVEAAPARRFKWMGGGKTKPADGSARSRDADNNRDRKVRPSTEMGVREHQFQQHSTMRLGRCELCQDKMWGLQEVKCASCGLVCHSKCADKLPKSCYPKALDDGPMPPSMFGRDIIEQAKSDGEPVPHIVTKCINAVEANGMEYEGIYRKSGGNSQTKNITHLFERGRYDAFDLNDEEAFNDISAITSVLKTYFRNLPEPLMTFNLHESFVAAANIRDKDNKHAALCALLPELPSEHYITLKTLMLHLNRVMSHSSVNLMTSQNLGVVFGPTLLRSKEAGREFGDMGGKALTVQWMVENAQEVFKDDESNSD